MKVYGDKTSKGEKVLFGFCTKCNRKKSMIVNDNTMEAERLGDFFEKLGKKGLYASKAMAKNVLSNPRPAPDLTAKIATAAVSKNFKQALSTLPDLITIYNTGKGLYSVNLYKLCHIKGAENGYKIPASTTIRRY